MKKFILLTTITFSTFVYSQSNEELKKEIQLIKSDISELKSEIQTIKSENINLKKALEINKPILEYKDNNSEYVITKVVGDKIKKTISITFLIEAKDENRKNNMRDIYIVDLDGNEYTINHAKSSSPYIDSPLNVPIKLTFTFDKIENETTYLKIFKLKNNSSLESNGFDSIHSIIEFRDLKVTWN